MTETPIKDKVTQLRDWMPEIIECIKKDIKNEHLRKDFTFIKKYFNNKNPNKLDACELSAGYLQAIHEEERGAEIAEFIAHRWILRNSEMYHLFESQLSLINPNFTEIQELPEEKSSALMERSIAEFGALRTYLFSILNCVAFSSDALNQLKERALKDRQVGEEQKRHSAETRELDELVLEHQQQVTRLTDRYEKKISGLQKKYVCDVEALKKQVAHLQRRLSGAQ
jgi:hypothetical protein